MDLNPSANEALATMRAAERRSLDRYGYAIAAPYLFIGGTALLGSGLLHQFGGALRGSAWLIVLILAASACFVVGVRQSRGRGRAAQAIGEPAAALDAHLWRSLCVWLFAVAFLFASLYIFAPVDGTQIHSFAAVVSGAAYAVAGLWLGPRILTTGIAIVALALIGHAFVREYYEVYMGLVGGGGMMLGAWWLRKP